MRDRVLCDVVEIARSVTAVANRAQPNTRVETYGLGGSLTTREDVVIDKIIVDRLRATFPGSNVISEEAFKSSAAVTHTDNDFIVDPIDGSVNYSLGGKGWCCTIAHKVRAEVDVGVICRADATTLVYAQIDDARVIYEDSNGATALLRPTPSARKVSLRDCVVRAPLSGEFSKAAIERVFAPLIGSVRLLAHGESNTSDILAFLLGYNQVFMGWGSLWDFAAGKLFVDMLGGLTSTFYGSPIDFTNVRPQRVLFAWNQSVLTEMTAITSAWPVTD